MNDVLLIDTDVIVDYLRAVPLAVDFIENASQDLLISAVTVGELFAGVREGSERATLDQFLSLFEIAPLDSEMAKQGGLFRRDYGKSHGTGLSDALIAATALVRNAVVVTLNQRHFPMLHDVHIPYRKSN